MDERGSASIKTEFAEWMRARLGYQHVETVAFLGARGRGVFVRGEIYRPIWRNFRLLAFGTFAVAVAHRNIFLVESGPPPALPNFLLAIAVVAYVVAQIGRFRTRECDWVECTNLKRSLTSRDARNLYETVQLARSSPSMTWKPRRILLVAGLKGFDRGGLLAAEAVGIECYRKVATGFERAS